jgi:hypothetical protein
MAFDVWVLEEMKPKRGLKKLGGVGVTCVMGRSRPEAVRHDKISANGLKGQISTDHCPGVKDGTRMILANGQSQ